ncbi:MAG: glycosyltransferase [Candidatus Latescibacteria bacterium]|nr:glycosyltransferase [Candidatus Latescibacterota bacterium]NIM65013.1 glycosyltransferase [Candidatus Latescibacterota bacterium]NIO28045.1 glycosyltransferase [Candidatus Latescibacterota bacterium]NIO55592.1 glycosyltransferase [Candidatus Latescibacterota bacterium]NIT01559.1 glycosyltransferase [Candidatus Latescibacterota bacterium]
MVELISRLPKETYEKRLYFLRRAGILGEELFSVGIEGDRELQRNRFDVSVISRLARRFKEFQPDIVFCLDHRNAIVFGGLATMAARIPRWIVASHSTGRFGRRRSFTLLERIFLRRIDRLVALSGAHADYCRDVEGIAARKLAVIENGIDVGRYQMVDGAAVGQIRKDIGLLPGDKVVSMVAALRPEKAHESVLEAARRLVAAHDDLKFLIVGDGPRREPLEELRTDLRLERNVRFLGQRRDVAELLHLSDILVLPSHAVVETLPLAVLEAMAAGVPVVASAVGSIPELIEDGISGKLIPPADPESLAGAIEELLSNEAAAARIVERARSVVEEKYSVQTMVAKYEELFESLLT